MTDTADKTALDDRIDAIESAYEYFLAYAAQGRRTDKDAGAQESSVREHLENMSTALDSLGSVARDAVAATAGAAAAKSEALFDAIEADAATAKAIVDLVASREDISSQLIDNLNASIHVRALLTDLFIVDEACKAHAG